MVVVSVPDKTGVTRASIFPHVSCCYSTSTPKHSTSVLYGHGQSHNGEAAGVGQDPEADMLSPFMARDSLGLLGRSCLGLNGGAPADTEMGHVPSRKPSPLLLRYLLGKVKDRE